MHGVTGGKYFDGKNSKARCMYHIHSIDRRPDSSDMNSMVEQLVASTCTSPMLLVQAA